MSCYYHSMTITLHPVLSWEHCTAVLSERDGVGGSAPVERVWWAGFHARMKVDIKSFLTEVKASKPVRRFERYSHFKIRDVVQSFGKIRYLVSIQDSLTHSPLFLSCTAFPNFCNVQTS